MRRLFPFFALFVVMVLNAEAAERITAAQIKNYSEIERAFILKVAENVLTSKAKMMFSDPENAKDGYLWARKVIVAHYSLLEDMAIKSNTKALAVFYEDKKTLLERHIRGQLSTDDFGRQEKLVETRKQLYLENLLSSATQPTASDVKTLNALALRLGDQIHGLSVIAISN
ncbi:MAG: hypothetical protein EOR84_30660 [Mesorhizobium sp.]|uniref:hypothetical protein n=1 Tax=Mesorhizobium sp. TaxID=1871066 RepID=UPI000FE7B96A|nr:hypothetical protein [Mesorhizobium sp.]RWM86477.1 MAG: hypothetical protein EOR84_30660 [Mesorhizobium sp.]